MTIFSEFIAGAIATLIVATWFLGEITWGIVLWYTLFGGEVRLKLNNPFKLFKNRSE